MYGSASRHMSFYKTWLAALAGGVTLFVMLALLPGQSPEVKGQSQEEAARRSAGCVSCHGFTEVVRSAAVLVGYLDLAGFIA